MPESPTRPLTARAVIVGLLLIPPNAWFILEGYIWGQSRPTTVSLYFNVIVSLLVVTGINALVRRVRASWALTQGELLVVYGMLAMASSVCGLDQVQTMLPVVAYPVWHATPENHWQELFLEKLPTWLTVTDTRALNAYYESGDGLFATPYWKPWLAPCAWWAGFSFTLIFVMLALNSLFRRQWTEEAKLSFPIVQLPLEIARPDTPLWRSRLMWTGFAAAFLIDALNGLHQLYPAVPSLLGERSAAYDLGQIARTMPWRAMGWTPLNIYPFGVGLGFFIPLDLAFSSWFFYVFWKLVRIGTAALGWGNLPRAPWIDEQSFGAYFALAMFCLWSSRKHLLAALRTATGLRSDAQRAVAGEQEAFSYSFAVWGAVVGFAALLAFCLKAGMSPGIALAFLVGYLAISIAVARIRAELGSPVHDLHKIGPEAILTELVGPKKLGVGNLIMFAFFWSINRAHRSHPMPNQIEAMKLASVSGTSQRGLAGALTLATGVGLICGWLILLHLFFVNGGERWAYKGFEAFGRLQQSLESPLETNWYGAGSLALGVAFTIFLTAMRTRFLWWPFHPAGFAVSGSWSMSLFAPSLLVSWLVKALLLRYGGMGSYRPATHFFMGLILGEFVAGFGWGLLGNLLHLRMYNFLP